MSIMLIIEAKVKPEKIADIKPFFAEILPDTRNFEGCEQINICFGEQDPHKMVFVEKWKAKENYEKYHHWRAETGTLQKLREFLDGPVRRTFLEVADV